MKLIILKGVSADELRAALNDPRTPTKDDVPIVRASQEVTVIPLKKQRT